MNNYLVPDGYGVIDFDFLGSGESSKPTEPASYSWGDVARDVVEILDAEGLPTVISVGHDWGSLIGQRLYKYYPTRVSGVVMINLAYTAPTGQFDFDSINILTQEVFGAGI